MGTLFLFLYWKDFPIMDRRLTNDCLQASSLHSPFSFLKDKYLLIAYLDTKDWAENQTKIHILMVFGLSRREENERDY